MTFIRLSHDSFFRKALQNPLVAREFFETHLPEEIRYLIDLDTLKMEKESFVEASLKKSISDVLFSVNFKNSQGYLYTLVEHQSSSDHWIAFRLVKYMVNIWGRYLDLNPKATHLPIIYTAVFYNGKKPYTAPENLWDLFYDKELSRKIFVEGYKLINLQKISDDEIKEKKWAGTMAFFMKHIYERNLLKRWEEISDNLPEFAKLEFGYDYIRMLLSYSLPKMEENDKLEMKNLLYKTLGEEGEEQMVSITQSAFNDGEAQGIEKGIEKAAINMLKQNFDVTLISKVTGLSAGQIHKLKLKTKVCKIEN